MTLQDVFNSAKNPYPAQERKVITDAFALADAAHHGQTRRSGEPYIQHCLHVATLLSSLGMDARTVAAGLLHDVPEDTSTTLDVIRKKFGDDIAAMVDGITKLGRLRLRGSSETYFIENLRKMFFAMAADIRVVIIKLADRLHNMRTLSALPKEKQQRIARETREIFAPIANRLGINSLKAELEDLAFQYLEPESYTKIADIAQTYRHDHDAYIERALSEIKTILVTDGIKPFSVSGRTKALYSLYLKLERHDMDIRRVYDIIAIRVIVNTVADCYETLGIIHKRYRPLVGRIKDYISLPKPNGYQSLHTTIFGPEGRIIEVQIRTAQMHDEAEFGIAAHWIYSERAKRSWLNFLRGSNGAPHGLSVDDRKSLAWVRQLREWQSELGRNDTEFMESLKIDFFKNHIFAFTPRGDIIDLPEDATPIDFAYAIHSEVGNSAVGARIDGKMVALDSKITNGQMVEILTSKDRKHPNRDWLGFAKTSTARSKIRQELRKQEAEKEKERKR